ncbi:hypothetical protein KAR48_15945 [bacterium]|nr:hypothetical protein [bacterium]
MKQWILTVIIILSSVPGFSQFRLYLDQQISISTKEITCTSISHDGRFLAIGSNDGRVHIIDLPAKREIHRLNIHKGPVRSIVFDQKSRWFISGGRDGNVNIHDLYSGRHEKRLSFGSKLREVTLSPDDRFLAACGRKKEIYLWEFPIGKLRAKLKAHKKSTVGIAFSQGGDQLLSVAEDRQMIVWDINRLAVLRKVSIEARTMNGSGLDIQSSVCSVDRRIVGIGIEEHILAKGGRSMIFKHNLSIFDWSTGTEIVTLTGNRSDLNVMILSPDKQFAMTDHSTLQTSAIAFWSLESGVIVHTYPLDGEVTAMAVSDDGQWLVAGYSDASRKTMSYVNVWKLSGVSGYERFAQGESVRSDKSGFGPTIKITTPKEPLISIGQRRRLAVLQFDSPGLEADIAKTAAYLLEGKLGNSPLIELVERNQIAQVLEELKLQQTGITVSNAAEIGQQLNAEHMLLGSINKLGSLLIITVKLVNVETGHIEGVREVQCSNATIETISDMISVLAPIIVKY